MMRHRRAVSLVEMVLVISVVSIALAFIANIFYGLFRVDQQTRTRLLDARQLARLSIQFREDVHRAVAIREQSIDHVTLDLPRNQQIIYRSRGDRVERRWQEGASLRHRETFAFSHDLHAHWEEHQPDIGRPLRLCIRRRVNSAETAGTRANPSEVGRLVRCIEAVPGLDYPATGIASQSQESIQ